MSIDYEDVRASDFEISLSKLSTKKIADIKGYLSRDFGDVTFQITGIVFEDGSEMGVEGEHDFPYVTVYKKHPIPNFDDETLEALCQQQEARDRGELDEDETT